MTNKALRDEIKKDYPHLNDTFIDLAIDYCNTHSEEEVIKLLEETDTKLTRSNQEELTFSVE